MKKETKVYCKNCKWRGINYEKSWEWCEYENKYIGIIDISIRKRDKNSKGECIDYEKIIIPKKKKWWKLTL